MLCTTSVLGRVWPASWIARAPMCVCRFCREEVCYSQMWIEPLIAAFYLFNFGGWVVDESLVLWAKELECLYEIHSEGILHLLSHQF